ncbi:uncharacterized protein LOC103577599 isoform X2 [Microplitis demolitor]|uniref:uncharacterized protein LOC103577599 isoform X2 n=1 Tax=Microplitis demolitor TaxID=69319 RepID=UPI0004CDD208|nr:uncharacterized protein LOC103577599 isoform X2 [Microplitis demolitor]
MGSSTASETTINTSTDSANTQVTIITTTDSEQHDDSMDLADDPLELSPPAVSNFTSNSTSPPARNGANNAEAHYKNSTISTTQHTTVPTVQSPPTNMLSKNEISPINGVGAPPPTPLLGARHENKFSFNIGRIPALPDLRTAEFFSTPVRGSVDAGQPDSNQLNSMLALIAAKENQSTIEEETSNHITPANNTIKTMESLQQSVERDKFNGGSVGKMQKTSKPSINVTTNPLDISLCTPQPPCAPTQQSTGTKGRCKPPESHPLVSAIHSWVRLFFPFCAIGGSGGGTKRTAQATIVVQQPSLSLDAPAATILLRPDVEACRREENMRQLLDVTHTLTLQEIHDFEMRYGSPHHSRSQSVKTPGSRSSGRPNYLCLPQQRSRVASMPNTGVEEEYYRLRHFSITGKGIVNRGDSLKSRRSRSNNSVASSNSSTEHLTASYPGSARNSAAGSLASSRESSASQGSVPYKILMLGAPSVGKSSLVSQFMTSEYLHAYDTSIDDESGEKTVSVLLADEESELTFIDHPSAEMTPENCIATYEPQAYCVVYSTTDEESLKVAEQVLQILWRSDLVSARAVILVGNKVDLVRSRSVATEKGKSMAISYDCKFIETSVGINHNVDELLVGLLTQIRLKLENPERTRDLFRKRSRKNRSRSPLGSCSENNSPKKYRGSRTSASLKVRSLLGKVWARDSKSKSCENLHVL